VIEGAKPTSMVAAKGGIKLQPSGEGGCVTQNPGMPPLASVPGQKLPNFCGAMATSPRSMNATVISMEQFATALSNTMQRTVIDRTGFAEKFDVHLEWTADQSTPGLFAPGLAPHDPEAAADVSGGSVSSPRRFSTSCRSNSD
jgi:uncharacterized protein (TIGR03435 family)